MLYELVHLVIDAREHGGYGLAFGIEKEAVDLHSDNVVAIL